MLATMNVPARKTPASRPVVAAAALWLATAAHAAGDEAARTALDDAFARQRALPGYVEHQFGRTAVTPGVADALIDMATARLKEKATEKLQEKIADATARVPLAPELSERALAGLGDEAEEAMPTMGPVREIAKVEHAGKRERHVLADGMGEIVRGDGQMAYRFNLPAQVTAMQLVTTAQSTVEVAKEARSTIGAIKALTSALAQGGFVNILGVASAALDQTVQLLRNARTSADLIQASVTLQKLSGTWQCRADRDGPQYPTRLIEAHPLADETVGGVPTHVYLAIRGIGTEGPARSEAAADEEGRPQWGFRLENRVWVRVSDGLPLRSELSLPGGTHLRTEFEYPAAIGFPTPVCANRPT